MERSFSQFFSLCFCQEEAVCKMCRRPREFVLLRVRQVIYRGTSIRCLGTAQPEKTTKIPKSGARFGQDRASQIFNSQGQEEAAEGADHSCSATRLDEVVAFYPSGRKNLSSEATQKFGERNNRPSFFSPFPFREGGRGKNLLLPPPSRDYWQ